jgi:hypothetical protein
VGELVDDVSIRSLRPCVILDEVMGPHVVGTLRPRPDARPIGEPKTPPLGLFVMRHQPLAPPDPLDTSIANRPAGVARQGRNLAVTVAAILPGQPRALRRLAVRHPPGPSGPCAASSGASAARARPSVTSNCDLTCSMRTRQRRLGCFQAKPMGPDECRADAPRRPNHPDVR